MVTTDTTMLSAALEYVALGWHVFPLHTPRPGGQCSCRKKDCTNQGKHPRTKNGLNDATDDPGMVESWWGMWPDANIGVSCGPSGILALDVDPKNGGDESLADLRQKYGKDAFNTVSSHTGGGGEHYIYAALAGIPIANVVSSSRYTGPLGPGIDVRAAGGYIVAPPSEHVSGNAYEWYEGESPFEKAPQRLPLPFIDLLETRDTRPAGDSTPISAADILAGVPAGERDWKLFQLASKLRYADVPIDFAYYLVERAAANCTPAFPASEARKKVESAYNRYEAGKGAFVTEEQAQRVAADAEGLSGREFLGPAITNGAPETDWLVDQLLVRGRIHMLYGEPESGKTIIALSWALQAIARGQRVLYIDEESGIPAVAGLLRDMGADAELVDSLIHYFPFPDIDGDRYAALLAYADELQPDLVLFDSLTDMLAAAGLDENSGIEVTSWMNEIATAIARREYLPAVVLIDHVPKDTENVRYSVASRAKKAKSDVLWYVRKIADFDRESTARVELERHKNRPGVLPKKVTYTIGGQGGTLVCRPFDVSQDVVESQHPMAPQFLQILAEKGPCGRREMEQFLGGVSKDTVFRVANELEKTGRIQRVGATTNLRYQLVASDELLVASDEPTRRKNSSQSTPFMGASATSLRVATSRHYWQDKEEDEKPWQ